MNIKALIITLSAISLSVFSLDYNSQVREINLDDGGSYLTELRPKKTNSLTRCFLSEDLGENMGIVINSCKAHCRANTERGESRVFVANHASGYCRDLLNTLKDTDATKEAHLIECQCS